MIFGVYIECETCGHHHTLRIGIGHEETQRHIFACADCKENIGVILNIGNSPNVGLNFENAKQSDTGGSVINLDTNFLVDPNSHGADHLKNRVQQMHDIFMAQKNHHDEMYGEGSFERSIIDTQDDIPPMPLETEWRLLKKAWSLSRNEKQKLARKKIDDINASLYKYDTVDHLEDWIWRFSSKLCMGRYEILFQTAMEDIITISQQPEFKNFISYFEKNLYSQHIELHYDIFKQFFQSFSVFNQVMPRCQAGLDIPAGFEVPTKDFDSIKMFYGNAYEAFTSLVEVFACLNNIKQGRAYDAFETMTLKDYKLIDKSGRCNPFKNTPAFSILCQELDGQIRNASHHGSIWYDQASGEVKYISGKGGIGQEKTISYTDYVSKCVHVFLSISLLFRIELVLSRQF